MRYSEKLRIERDSDRAAEMSRRSKSWQASPTILSIGSDSVLNYKARRPNRHLIKFFGLTEVTKR